MSNLSWWHFAVIFLLVLIAIWVRPRKPYQGYKKHPEYKNFLNESDYDGGSDD